ncbi:g4641 [Coccomyxa elongata]
MWLPWPLSLCINRHPEVQKKDSDQTIRGNTTSVQAIASPLRQAQPLSESPIPSPAPPEGQHQLLSKEDALDIGACTTTTAGEAGESCADGVAHTAGKRHRPSQLSLEDVDIVDIRSPHPGLQRTPVPLTPQSTSSAVSTTLDILRTPMPFGSPVPDPSRPTSLGQALGGNLVHERTIASRTGYANLPYIVPFELRNHLTDRPSPDTPVLGLKKSGQTLKRPARPSPLQSDSLSNKGNPFQTPSPLEHGVRRYALSSQDSDSTPHIFGVSNPATVYKEDKAIRLRHTPFNERVDKEVQKERRFSERLSVEKAAGQKT